jgi:hypothetical protein
MENINKETTRHTFDATIGVAKAWYGVGVVYECHTCGTRKERGIPIWGHIESAGTKCRRPHEHLVDHVKMLYKNRSVFADDFDISSLFN